MKQYLLRLFYLFLLPGLCGCAKSGFIAVSISGKNDGGIYCIKSENKIIHTPLPATNCIIRSRKNGLYYATQNGTRHDRNGKVSVIQKNANGTVKILQTVSVNAVTPCHLALSPDEKFLYTANYSSGNISEFPIRNGKLLAPPRLIQHTGSGVTKRQKAPHPHFVGFNPDTKELFVCDLGTDEIVIYNLTPAGAKAASKLKLAPGSGPRHLAFAPDGKTIYVANELSSTVTSFVKTADAWKMVKTISSRPENPAAKNNYPGAIKITSCGRFFFVTNRGDDTIAMFETLENGDFRLCKNVPSQGKYPSDLLFADDETLLFTVNLKSGNITGFRLNKANCDLEPLSRMIPLPRGIGLCE